MASSSRADASGAQTPDTGNSCLKHPYAQIVRSNHAAASSTKKMPQVVNPRQIPSLGNDSDTNQVRGPQSEAELSIDSPELNLGDQGIATDTWVIDEVKGEESTPASKTVAGLLESGAANAVATYDSEARQNKAPEGGDTLEPRVSRQPWQKPPVVTEGEVKPQLVMGATAWPALAEARNMKNLDTRKSKDKTLPVAPDASIQEPLPKPGQPGDSSIHQHGIKNRPPFKGAAAGVSRPAFQPIENGTSSVEHPTFVSHRGPEQLTKHNPHARMKNNFGGNQHIDNDRVLHQRNDGGAPFINNNRNRRNNNRDQGRGNFGWHQHGRAYENAGDMFTLLHEQRIGPRNMPRPQSFMNMNPPFYSMPPQFQNGGMYYIPPGAPEFLHGPYFPPMGPAGGVMHGPDASALRAMLLQQIEYYFSVENLCRDVYLRKQMDEEGFVPVSVIAQFNRVRNLSPNPAVILEALQLSEVVEIQHNRIRRRNDGAQWRLPAQVAAGNSVQKGISMVNTAPEGAHRQTEQAIENMPASSSVETSNGSSANVVDMPLADMEKAQLTSDRVYDIDDQASSASGADTFAALSRGGGTKEVKSSIDLSGCESPNSNPLQTGSECVDINEKAYIQENSTSTSMPTKENGMVSCTIADRKPGYWKAPEGFRIEDDSYRVQRCLKQDTTQLTESDFVLKVHEDGDEHHGEANDRDVQRLISVPHTSLGSFIAVP